MVHSKASDEFCKITGIPQDSYTGWAGGDEIGWRGGEPGLNWGYDANQNNFVSIRPATTPSYQCAGATSQVYSAGDRLGRRPGAWAVYLGPQLLGLEPSGGDGVCAVGARLQPQ